MTLNYPSDMKHSDLNVHHVAKIARLIRSHGGDDMATDWMKAAMAYNAQPIAQQQQTSFVDYGDAFRIDIWFDEKRHLINVECDAIQSGLFFECQALTESAKRVYS